MGYSAISWLFRFSLILGLLSFFSLLISIPQSGEFYISLIAVFINTILGLVSLILLRKKVKEQ